MIQAKEVMLNDWLLDKSVDDKYRYFQVKGIDPDDDGYICKNKFGYSYSDEFEPIPLTPEILEKNWFSEHGNGFYVYEVICRFRISVNFLSDAKEGESKIVVNISCLCSHKDGSNSLHSCDINYVHELQHALRLCGLTKLADNFKIE